MAAHAVHDLLAHGDDLLGERESEITLHELRDQGVAGLVSLLDGGFLVDFRGAVRGVDLSAHPDRERDLSADESEAAVLHLEEPVGLEHGGDQPLNTLQQGGVGDQSASEEFSGKFLCRGLEVVEIHAYILSQIGIGPGDVDLGHAQTYGGATLLLGGAFLVTGGFHGGILRERDGNRFFERKHLFAGLCETGRRQCRSRRDGDLENCFHTVS